VWAIRSASATVAYLDLDRRLVVRNWGPGSPRFPNDGRLVPLVRVTSTRGDTGIIRVGDRHELLTDPGGSDYQYWIPQTCTSIEPVAREDIPVADPRSMPDDGLARGPGTRPDDDHRPEWARLRLERTPGRAVLAGGSSARQRRHLARGHHPHHGRWIVRTRSSAYLVEWLIDAGGPCGKHHDRTTRTTQRPREMGARCRRMGPLHPRDRLVFSASRLGGVPGDRLSVGGAGRIGRARAAACATAHLGGRS